jgi:hypothetical protein
MVGIEAKATRNEALTQQHSLEDKIEVNKRDRLEVVEVRTWRRITPTIGVRAVQPSTFNGNTSWSVFRLHFEIIADHNQFSDREK